MNLNLNLTTADQSQPQPYPRLSTHILLGDHLRERDPNSWLSKDGRCGCAFGGAIISIGRSEQYQTMMNEIYNWTTPMDFLREIWVWLDKKAPANQEPVDPFWFPLHADHFVSGVRAGGYGPYTNISMCTFIWVISDLFMRVHYGSLTIEQLTDQVRLWEEEYDDDLRLSITHAASLAPDHDGQRIGDLVSEPVASLVSVS